MTIEYRNPKQQRRRATRRRNAIPAAGPVTTTKPDGSTTTEPAKTRNVDKPGRTSYHGDHHPAR